MKNFIVSLILVEMLFIGAVDTAEAATMLWVESLSREEMMAMFTKKRGESKSSDASGKEKKSSKKVVSGKSFTNGMIEMFYLYSGFFPDKKRNDTYLQNTHFWLEDPDGSIKGLNLRKKGGPYMVVAPNKNGGWYQLTAYNDYGVENGIRFHLFSQSSFLNHSDTVKKDEPEQIERAGFYEGRPIMEIVQLVEDMQQQYAIRSGDELQVKVFLKGKTVKGAHLTLITEKNWQKKIKTDEKGEGLFTLIKETFSEGKIDKSRVEKYLLIAVHEVDGPGNHNGRAYEKQRYIVTLPLRVYPSSLDWESKSTGYLVAMFGIGIISFAVAIRRKKRRKDEGR